MAEMKKADVDKAVRDAGEILVDVSNLTKVAGNIWIGHTVVDGHDRFFEIKIVAKKIGFSSDDINALLDARAEVDARKESTKAAAAKKSVKDKARRADAKAKAEAKANEIAEEIAEATADVESAIDDGI